MLRAGSTGRLDLWVPPGDDAAVLHDGLVLTTDLLVEGVHFDHRLSSTDVGFKAVAVSVSDLTAMAARPTWMLLSLAVPQDDDFTQGFALGLAEACDRWGVELVGGDTTGTPGARFVSVTLAGRCPGPVVLRSGGRPGHVVLVTGTPGLAALGYLSADPPPEALAALRRPEPPLAWMLAAAPWVSAAMDLSDGLAQDLPRLARASGVGARIDPSRLPRPRALHGPQIDPRTLQLAGGDDYQLLLTAAPADVPRLRSLARDHGIDLHEIGELTPPGPVRPTDGDWPRAPWQHHREATP